MTDSKNTLHLEPRQRPSGRSARIGADVIEATVAILMTGGLAAITFESVAAKAGINRSTLYRRWNNRNRLVTWVMLEYVAEQVPPPDTGSLESDFVRFIMNLDQLFATPFAPALFQMLVVEAYKDEAIAEVSANFWHQRLTLAKPIVENAVARGEVPADIDQALLVDMVFGPFYFRHWRDRKRISKTAARKIVRVALLGMGVGSRDFSLPK